MSVAENAAANGSSPSALELAQAVYEGLESRRWPTPRPLLEVPDPPELRNPGPALVPFSSPLGLPAQAKPGPLARPIRFARRVVKVLLRPWLDAQTRFNHTVIESLEQAHVQGQEHLRRLSQHLKQQELRVRKLADRLDECRFNLTKLREELEAKFEPQEGGRPPALLVKRQVLELIFAHTRLPRPPARVLDLGRGESACGAELASLGYPVVGVGLHESAALPFTDDSFDAAVCVSALGRLGAEADQAAAAEVYRVLRPGGRFVLTVPYGSPGPGPGYDRDRLDRLLARFVRVETAFAARGGGGWEFTTDEAAAAPGAALVVAERA